MADIAMLVAEEYERRVKSSRRSGQEVELLSCVGFLGSNLKEPTLSWIREKLDSAMESGRSVSGGGSGLGAKSQMSIAATNGFFSA